MNKSQNGILCLLKLALMLSFAPLVAQPRHCSKQVQHGDTTICQRINEEGRLQWEHFYLHGKRIFTRRWTHYGSGAYEFIQVTGKGPFAKANGPNVRYFPEGNVQYSTNYRNGKIVGPTTNYFPSGAVESTCLRQVRKGKWDGLANFYYPNGNICSKRLYKDGRLFSILAYKDEEGNNLPIGTFKEGNGDWVICVQGRPVLVETYRNGILRKTKIVDKGKDD